jgi:hypothetical protein
MTNAADSISSSTAGLSPCCGHQRVRLVGSSRAAPAGRLPGSNVLDLRSAEEILGYDENGLPR